MCELPKRARVQRRRQVLVSAKAPNYCGPARIKPMCVMQLRLGSKAARTKMGTGGTQPRRSSRCAGGHMGARYGRNRMPTPADSQPR